MIYFMDILSHYVCLFFFFFQAEDGIRDLTVTGVQTCALPIYSVAAVSPSSATAACKKKTHYRVLQCEFHLSGQAGGGSQAGELHDPCWRDEIGRASCRERV